MDRSMEDDEELDVTQPSYVRSLGRSSWADIFFILETNIDVCAFFMVE
jgi:hypothetical protein